MAAVKDRLVRAIAVDHDLLARSAGAAIHAGNEGWRHMRAEFVGDIDGLMTTLTPDGPYAYTIMPQIHADGSITSPILSSREDIREAYVIVRGRSDLLGSEPLVEIRSSWYQFTEAVSRARQKGQDQINANHLISLFPLSGDAGITGELVWVKVPREKIGTEPAPADAPDDELSRRRDLLALHDRYIAALLAGDADGVADCLTDGSQGAVRDYVADTGTLVPLDGRDANRAYYAALFDKYDFEAVDLLHRVAQEWYLFAELRLEARRRDGGERLAFHTAEFAVPARDGRFALRVGHGTDPGTPSAGAR